MKKSIWTVRLSSRSKFSTSLRIARTRKQIPRLGQGIEFFSFLRKMTADGFFTSEIGINYLGYIGNTYMSEFPGCPPVPGE